MSGFTHGRCGGLETERSMFALQVSQSAQKPIGRNVLGLEFSWCCSRSVSRARESHWCSFCVPTGKHDTMEINKPWQEACNYWLFEQNRAGKHTDAHTRTHTQAHTTHTHMLAQKTQQHTLTSPCIQCDWALCMENKVKGIYNTKRSQIKCYLGYVRV